MKPNKLPIKICSCRAVKWPFWFGLLVPFLALYIFDWIMFIVILVSIAKHKRHLNEQTQSKADYKYIKENIIIALSLAVVFGLGWGFGLLATSYPVEALTITLQVIFSIFVGAQGVLLFVLHGVRNSDAQRLWKNWLSSISTTTRISYFISSDNTISAKIPDKSLSGLATKPGTQSCKRDLFKTEKCENSEPIYHEIGEEVKRDLAKEPAQYEEVAFGSGFSLSENMSYGLVANQSAHENVTLSENALNHYEFAEHCA